MSRNQFAVAEKLPVAKIAVIRRPIAPPFARDEEDAFAKIDELLDLEAPTRRGADLVRELAAASARMDDGFSHEEKPTAIVGPQENLRRIAAAFGGARSTDDEITLDEPAPFSAPRSGVQLKAAAQVKEPATPKEDQTLLVAGIWAAALGAMGVLAFFLTGT